MKTDYRKIDRAVLDLAKKGYTLKLADSMPEIQSVTGNRFSDIASADYWESRRSLESMVRTAMNSGAKKTVMVEHLTKHPGVHVIDIFGKLFSDIRRPNIPHYKP